MKKNNSSQWIAPDFNDFVMDVTPSQSKLAVSSFSTKAPGLSVDSKQKKESKFVSFVTKYEPRTINDLAVNKKKITDVERWLKSAAVSNRKFLLLTGPAGSGKTATLKALANHLHMEIIEWTNSQNFRTFGGGEYSGSIDVNASAQSQDFIDFLLRAEKCSTLTLSTTAKHEGKVCGKIILVEEIPNAFVRDSKDFWNTLRYTGRKMRVPVVFVCTDSHGRQQQQQEFNYKRLFPANILEELHFTVINFNPIALTSLVKVLKNILANETHTNRSPAYNKRRKGFKKPDSDHIEQIAAASNGDIRSAINSLQFALCNDSMPDGAIFERDSCMLLFRALGKFLYSKRQPCKIDDGILGKPPALDNLKPRSGDLTFDPELVVEHSGYDPEMFSLFLHENYLNFTDDIDTIMEISRMTSFADYLNKEWSVKNLMNPYTGSLIGRAVAYYMDDQQKKEKSLKLMNKPIYLTVSKNVRKNNELLIEHFELIETRSGSALRLDIVPYLAKLSNIVSLKSVSQRKLIENIGRLPIKQQGGQFFKTFQPPRGRFNTSEQDLSFVYDDGNEDDEDENTKLHSTQTESIPESDDGIDTEMLDCIEEYDE